MTSLFKVVTEKIPFQCLNDAEKAVKTLGLPTSGICLAHDSMGAVRYAGRRSISSRLRTRKKAQPLQLFCFSLYVVRNQRHEHGIETLVIRATTESLNKARRHTASHSPASVRGDGYPLR